MKTRKRICIFGESPLVEEYASLCLNKGLDAQVRFNPGSPKGNLTKSAKQISKPGKIFQIGLELTNISLLEKKKNLIELDRALSPKSIILSSSITVSVEEQATWIKQPARLAGLGALPSLIENDLVELAPSGSTNATTIAASREFIGMLGKESSIVQDSVGMVLPRILCMLMNEACFAIMEGVAIGREIDTAMKLGTNYPQGPVEWGKRIGWGQVHAVMEALYRNFGDDRYRVAPLLRKAAFNGVLAAS